MDDMEPSISKKSKLVEEENQDALDLASMGHEQSLIRKFNMWSMLAVSLERGRLFPKISPVDYQMEDPSLFSTGWFSSQFVISALRFLWGKCAVLYQRFLAKRIGSIAWLIRRGVDSRLICVLGLIPLGGGLSQLPKLLL